MLRSAEGAAAGEQVVRPCGHIIAGQVEKMSPDSGDPIVAGQDRIALRRGQRLESDQRPAHHGEGDDPVESRHRSRRQALQQLIQGEDLGPIGVRGAGRLVVEGGDRRLQLIWTNRRLCQRLADEGEALGDGLRVPQPAVLLGERDQGAVGPNACRATGIG